MIFAMKVLSCKMFHISKCTVLMFSTTSQPLLIIRLTGHNNTTNNAEVHVIESVTVHYKGQIIVTIIIIVV